MDRRDSTSTASAGAPSIFSPASPSNKRRHVSSDETDPTSISSNVADRTNPKSQQSPPPQPQPQPRPHKMVIAEEGDSDDEYNRNVGRRPISSDPYPLGPIRTFAIEPDHPLVERWAPIHDAIKAALEQQSHLHHWCAIEVFRRRRTLKPSPEGTEDTTVMITMKKGTDANHQAVLMKSIKDICNAHNQPALQVEIVEGSITRLASTTHLHEREPMVGSSIGVAGLDWSSGTLGPYVAVQLSPTEEPFCCALTCHHVLRPTRHTKPVTTSTTEALPLPYDSELDVVGCYHLAIDRPNPSLRVQQPSAADHEAARRTLKDQLAETDVTIATHEKEIEMGMQSRLHLRGLETARRRHETYQRLLAEIDAFECGLGHVWATSGYRVAAFGCAVDWGLVQMDEKRVGSNELPVLKPSRVPSNLNSKTVKETSIMSLGEDLVLYGKNSGSVHGQFNAIKSSIVWPEHQGVTTEYVVAGRKGQAFALPGDSGGIVVNQTGALVGLLIAGAECRGTGYVTPIQVIWDDIKMRTGCEVSLL